jgi:RsiW-degrading membrane proteinase PrsW (M82 family)
MLAVIGVLLALVPGFAWLFFYLQEDPHPEPVRSIVRTFVAGIGCAFVALAIQIGLSKVGVTPWTSSRPQSETTKVR